MLLGARQFFSAKKKADLFEQWYPRWGTEDLVFAFNGIYNAGTENPHSSQSNEWLDIANGHKAVALNSSQLAPLWEPNGMRFDSNRRTLTFNMSASSFQGFTIEAFGYFGMNWGFVVHGAASIRNGNVFFVYASGNNIGATIYLYNKKTGGNYGEYQEPTRPTTSDLVLTCDSQGNVQYFSDGVKKISTAGGSGAATMFRSTRLFTIGGEPTIGIYNPNGSILYGTTLYNQVLSDDEIARLYQENKKNYIGI